MVSYVPLDAPTTPGPGVAISSVRTTSARGNLKVSDDEKDEWDVVEAPTAEAVEEVVVKVVEPVPDTYVRMETFMSQPFGQKIDAFVKRIEYLTTYRWKGSPSYLFTNRDARLANARRRQHDNSGNTTYPCPVDLEMFLKPRPNALRMINPEGFEERSFARSVDLESEDSYEAADLSNLTEDQVQSRDWAKYMSRGREHNRRYRMP
jgi:hypothetical protein